MLRGVCRTAWRRREVVTPLSYSISLSRFLVQVLMLLHFFSEFARGGFSSSTQENVQSAARGVCSNSPPSLRPPTRAGCRLIQGPLERAAQFSHLLLDYGAAHHRPLDNATALSLAGPAGASKAPGTRRFRAPPQRGRDSGPLRPPGEQPGRHTYTWPRRGAAR